MALKPIPLDSVKTGADHERFVAAVLESAGYTVRRVGGSGDYGADLLVSLRGKTDAVIQCKFYTNPVGYDAVKETYTAKAIYKASTAFVMSNASPPRRAATRRDPRQQRRNCRATQKGYADTII